jgi:hypothetical protein
LDALDQELSWLPVCGPLSNSKFAIESTPDVHQEDLSRPRRAGPIDLLYIPTDAPLKPFIIDLKNIVRMIADPFRPELDQWHESSRSASHNRPLNGKSLHPLQAGPMMVERKDEG